MSKTNSDKFTTEVIDGRTVKVATMQEVKRLTDKNIVKYAKVLEKLKNR